MTLATRISRARSELFVGRATQLAALEAALDLASSVGVLLVTGELGIGKTALLMQFTDVVAARGGYPILVEARNSNCQRALDAAAIDLRAARLPGHRPVLVLDGFQDLTAVEHSHFLRYQLPALPADTLVVIASRRESVGVQPELRGLPWPFFQRLALGPLSAAEAGAYLLKRDVPLEEHGAALAHAAGVPLLLHHFAERRLTPPQLLESMWPTVRDQVTVELGPPPRPRAHRVALATLVLARAVTLDLLAWVLDADTDAEAIYHWMVALSFVTSTSRGVRMNVAARPGFLAGFEEHHPALLAQVVRRARGFYDWQLVHADRDYPRWFADRLFLEGGREPTALRAIRFDDDTHGIRTVAPADFLALETLTRHQAGPESAAWARRWLEVDASTSALVESPARGIDRFAIKARVESAAWHPSLAGDPALALVDAHLLAAGWQLDEHAAAIVTRWSGGLDAPESISVLLAAEASLQLLRASHVHFYFLVSRTPSLGDMFDRGSFPRAALGSFHLDGHEYFVTGYDLRPRQRLGGDPTDPLRAANGGARGSDGTPQTFGILLRARLGQLAAAAKLTERENEVLDLVVLGRNASEIGNVLGITARTAKHHQARLLAKLGADSRMDLFRLLL